MQSILLIGAARCALWLVMLSELRGAVYHGRFCMLLALECGTKHYQVLLYEQQLKFNRIRAQGLAIINKVLVLYEYDV